MNKNSLLLSEKCIRVFENAVKDEDIGFWFCLKDEKNRVFLRRDEMLKKLGVQE